MAPSGRLTVLKSRRFEVQRWTFSDPAIGSREVVVHPGAVVVVPLLEGGRVVMVRNHRHAIGRHLLELPAGTLDREEPPAACAARELAEETGYRAGQLRPLCSFFSAPGFCTEELHAFVASDLTAGRPEPEPGEMVQAEVHSLESIRAMIAAGTIHDAKTMAALAVLFLRGGKI